MFLRFKEVSMSESQKNEEEKKVESLDQGAEEITIDSLQKEISDLKDQWLRAVAETENVRRRSQKEREDALKYAVSHFVRDILAVADNLRRAMESCPETEILSESVKSLVEGVGLTESELLSVFDRHGIKKISPLHEKFDPHFHQAMFEVESEEKEPGVILQVLQDGYTIHERLLRPALVGVAKTGKNQNDSTDVVA